MITLTTEQAQQIEEALEYARNVCAGSNWSTDDTDEALAAIRAARAQEQAGQESVASGVMDAIKVVLDDVEECQDHDGWTAMLLSMEAYHTLTTAYEEASAAPQPVKQEPVAWTATRLWNRKDTWKCSADIEKDLLYAAPQPVKQEPVAYDVIDRCISLVGTEMVSCKQAGDNWFLCQRLVNAMRDMQYELKDAAPQPVKQEPVAFINWNAATGERTVNFFCESELASEPLYTHTVQQLEQSPLGTAGVLIDKWFLSKSGISEDTLIYAAPVRTKDLTDDEIAEIVTELDSKLIMRDATELEIARAVIAAYKEKNK